MAVVTPTEGEEVILDVHTGKASMGSQVMNLFIDDHTHAEGDTSASFTPATFTTYAAVTMLPANFTHTLGNPSSSAHAQISYTTTDVTPQLVYGYYVTQATSGKVLYAETFTGGPKTVVNGGAALQIDYSYTLPE